MFCFELVSTEFLSESLIKQNLFSIRPSEVKDAEALYFVLPTASQDIRTLLRFRRGQDIDWRNALKWRERLLDNWLFAGRNA